MSTVHECVWALVAGLLVSEVLYRPFNNVCHTHKMHDDDDAYTLVEMLGSGMRRGCPPVGGTHGPTAPLLSFSHVWQFL